ncbi:MAG TPA: DUF2911 domain-containing protein [Chitinophagaceae bacterium]|nr:DUF2911 domain-containing protein [Chitinophagaceae bacterium]
MKLPGLFFFIISVSIFFISCKENEKPDLPQPKAETDSPDNTSFDTTANPYVIVDLSPMDMSYYPKDYPKLKMGNSKIAPPVMRMIYSRPHLEGREIFHDVLKYGDVWRLGANESTEIDFYRDVTIQRKPVKAGRYILYCILGPATWDIVLNSNVDSWGLEQDSTKDIQHFEIPVKHGNPELEYLTMVFEKTSTGADLIIAWDDVLAKLPIDFKD